MWRAKESCIQHLQLVMSTFCEAIYKGEQSYVGYKNGKLVIFKNKNKKQWRREIDLTSCISFYIHHSFVQPICKWNFKSLFDCLV